MKNKYVLFLIGSLFLIVSAFTIHDNEKKVLIKTNYGDITIKLYNETPIHRDNFLKLVEDKFYNGILFHRVIKDFMIQAGDPESVNAAPDKRLGSGSPGYTLPAEIIPKYFHKKGALSAARISDQVNPQRRSSGSQFYIVQGTTYTNEELKNFEKKLFTKMTDEQIEAYTTIGGTPHLDAQYTVFGEVISGLEIVDKIAAVQTGTANRPIADVKIIEMKIIK
jgi:peptidyl-prolyl cis-trans isomerase B (cyclophilin B)